MNCKAEDYHGRSCLFYGGNPLLLHTFRFVFIFSFIFLALKVFFLFSFIVDISLLFMGTLLQERQSVKFNFQTVGPYSLFSSENDSKNMHFLPCATFVENRSAYLFFFLLLSKVGW